MNLFNKIKINHTNKIMYVKAKFVIIILTLELGGTVFANIIGGLIPFPDLIRLNSERQRLVVSKERYMTYN